MDLKCQNTSYRRTRRNPNVCPQLPYLELLEYKARQFLAQDETFLAKLEEAKKRNKFAHIYLDAHVFPQVWGSTCLGFDRMPDGSPAIGGQAMTKAYTTVFHEVGISDIYIVFFGDKPAYKVSDPTEEFFEDLRNHTLAPISQATLRY